MSKFFVVGVLLLSLLSCAYAQQITIASLTAYAKWKNSNKRVYLNDDEELFRQTIFIENLQKINDHNSNPVNTYTISTNQFSDMTQEEFAAKILNNQIAQKLPNNVSGVAENASATATATTSVTATATATTPVVAASIDWRTKGAVQAIKNQGQCGSCWTFSSSALMESFNFLKNGKLLSFAEQQILDCVNSANGYYSAGCNGGSPYEALQYAAKFGIEQQSQYPYTAVQGACKVKSATTGYFPKTISQIGTTATALKTALNSSPVAVLVDASKFSSYSSGIFNGCSATITLNHAVLAIGYDASGNWIIKNSWGTSWGEKGFIRLAAGATCGVLSYGLILTA